MQSPPPPTGHGHAAMPSFSIMGIEDSMSFQHAPNLLTQAFSIKSFQDHKEYMRRSVTGELSAVESMPFPPDLIKSASNFGLTSLTDQNVLNQGILRHVAATVIQAVWKRYVARCLADGIREERSKKLQEEHQHNWFEDSVLRSQAAVRRYLAVKQANELRSMRESTKVPTLSQSLNRGPPAAAAAPHRATCQYQPYFIGTLTAEDLPPGSKFDVNGNRIAADYQEGTLMMHCAAVVIQRKVKAHVAKRFQSAMKKITKQRLSAAGIDVSDDGQPPPLQRKFSAAESVATMLRMVPSSSRSRSPAPGPGCKVPAPPSMDLIQRAFSRAGLNSGLSPRVRTPSEDASATAACSTKTTRLLPHLSSTSPTAPPLTGSGLAAVFWDAGGLLLNPKQSLSLWGLRLLHDVSMQRRQANPHWFTSLPLTIWVQGPLESDEQRRKRNEAAAASSPNAHHLSISRSITPRTKVRPSGSAMRRLSPLGRSPRRLLEQH